MQKNTNNKVWKDFIFSGAIWLLVGFTISGMSSEFLLFFILSCASVTTLYLLADCIINQKHSAAGFWFLCKTLVLGLTGYALFKISIFEEGAVFFGASTLFVVPSLTGLIYARRTQL